MSMSGQIMEYLARKEPQELAALGPQAIALELGGLSGERVSKLLWSLEHTGRLSLRRDGHSIVGIDKVLRVHRKNGQQDGQSVRIRRLPDAEETRPGYPRGPVTVKGVKTYQLDRYEAAKHRAQAIKGDDEYIQVTFREDPLAEEGLRVKNAYGNLMTAYEDLSTKYRMMLSEYEGVKARMIQRASAEVHRFRDEADRTD